MDIFGNGGVQENISQHLAPSVLNVLWAITAGIRFSRFDEQFIHLLDLMASRGRAFDMAGGILSQMPWIRYFAPNMSGYNTVCNLNQEFNQMLLVRFNSGLFILLTVTLQSRLLYTVSYIQIQLVIGTDKKITNLYN